MKNRFAKGFSLVEVAIAISIMVMGVVWVYSSINDMIRISNNATSRLEAGFLATEGMEFIKNKRDDNYVYYLNNKSKSPGCAPGYQSNPVPCNWLFGIRQNLAGADYYNVDFNSSGGGGLVPLKAVPAIDSACNDIAIFTGDNNKDRLKTCLENIYKDAGYQFLVKKKTTNLFVVDDPSYNSGDINSDYIKSQYKRLVVVSSLTPAEVASFAGKYSDGNTLCPNKVATVVDPARFDSQAAKDIIRVDSLVFWQSGKGIEFIHLATYMFNYHPYQ